LVHEADRQNAADSYPALAMPICFHIKQLYEMALKLLKALKGMAFKGFKRHGDGRIFLNISGPHYLMKTYRMNLISAGPSHWTFTLIPINIL
jgi:hypothetical protein